MLSLNYHIDSQSAWIEIHLKQIESIDESGELYKLRSPFIRASLTGRLFLEEYTDGDLLIRRLKNLNIPHELIPIWDGEASFIRSLPYLKTGQQN